VPEELPASVSRAIAAERDGFTVEEVLRKVRGDRVYYDVEGTLPDGEEIEFDVLMELTGPQIVEIQRDLEFADLPAEVSTLALETTGGSGPVRIIESVQTDGAVIYELFREGAPSDPAWEIRVYGGQVELLGERSIH
jgi:hypothetical protein